MRGRQRVYNTLEDSVDDKNKKLEQQLLSSCAKNRRTDYTNFIFIYKERAKNVNTGRRMGSRYTLTNVLTSLIYWDPIIKGNYRKLTTTKLEHIVLSAVSELPASTRNMRCGVLKTFCKHIKRPDLHECIKIVRTETNIKIEELVTAPDIVNMLDACLNSRDRALISLLYESGARRGEILHLSIRDVTVEQDGYRIRLDGKTGQRRILVIDSAPYLHQWLSVHPCRNDPGAPVFCTLEDGKRCIAVSTLELILKSAARRAGIKDKRLNPHAFRHAQATEKSRYFTDSQLRAYMGWSKDSGMPSVYDHLTGESLDDDIRKHHGMLPRSPDPITKAIECPRCHRTLTGEVDYCGFCTLPISDTARAKVEESNLRDLEEKAELQRLRIKLAREQELSKPNEALVAEMVERYLKEREEFKIPFKVHKKNTKTTDTQACDKILYTYEKPFLED